MKHSASVGIIHVKQCWKMRCELAAICKPSSQKQEQGVLISLMYVLPVIATRCLWICLTWPPSWFRGSGFPRWTRVSTPSSTWLNAATAPTAAAAMTQTKHMEGWGKDGQRLQSTEEKKKKLHTSQVYHHAYLCHQKLFKWQNERLQSCSDFTEVLEYELKRYEYEKSI